MPASGALSQFFPLGRYSEDFEIFRRSHFDLVLIHKETLAR